jgi:hypothetical protein
MSTDPFLLVAATALLCASCAEATPATSAPPAPAKVLDAYAGRATALFDDDIEPQALGYTYGGGRRSYDAGLLRERTRLGDRVVRARVVTVTSSDTGEAHVLHLGLHAVEELVPRGSADPDFTLDITGAAGGAGALRDLEPLLAGHTVIAFLRAYADAGDRPRVHFHLTRDAEGEADAVRKACVAVDLFSTR